MPIAKKQRSLHQIIITFVILFLCGAICICLISCQEKPEELPTEVEFQDIVNCAKILQKNIQQSDSFDTVFNGDYTFEIIDSCTHTYFNDTQHHRIHIPYRVSNTNGNEVVDVAYFLDGVYVGSKIDYDYNTYKTWDADRQAMFTLARLNTSNSSRKTYSSDLVTRSMNMN